MKNKTKSRFLKVKCNSCGAEQVIFGCASTKVKCLSCNSTLLNPTGGKAQITKYTYVLDILDKNI